ncbi:Hypothetical_protein [Hexamita inflata]|uniref:Hypothetical_protein n=1 Tax=Hexamita inflata TaxID=28002 RepID=A0AA86NJK4_9EUKA|nr:Hypothetical protein HINF_LOCUS8877 [Hexamita inflata]
MISNEIYSNALFTSSFNKSYVVHSSGEMFDFSGSSSEKVDLSLDSLLKAIELNVVSSIKVFHILTKMCRGVILLQLQVMLLSDGSVTCLRTQELTIEFMVVPHGINHNGPLYLQQSYYRSCTKTVHILHFEKILRIPLVFRCSEHSTRSICIAF